MDTVPLLLLASLIGGVLLVIWWLRNNAVYRYRINLICQIQRRCYEDVDRGYYDWHWRFEAFDSIGYNEMVFKFWRPLESFYPDKSFIKEAKDHVATVH